MVHLAREGVWGILGHVFRIRGRVVVIKGSYRGFGVENGVQESVGVLGRKNAVRCNSFYMVIATYNRTSLE